MSKIAPCQEWTCSRHGDRIEHRRVVGRLELLVEYDPSSEDGGVYWHVFCEGNGILVGKIGTRSSGPIAFLMNRGRREAELSVGIDQGVPGKIVAATPLRLHPDDIEAIAEAIAEAMRRG